MKKLISVLMAICLVLCLVPATVFADTAVELTEALAALEVTSQLPLEYQCELGSGQLYKKGGTEFYAELLKLTANAGEKLMISFYGSVDQVDTRILVYEAESDNSLTEICNIDSNEHIEDGEGYLFEVPENGVYYIALCGIDDDEQGKCTAKLERLDGNRTTLDFVTSDAPTSDATGLWTWNKQTKTLTLKDGFKLYMSEGNAAISLPHGATVVVEGRADLVAEANNEQYAIECEGDLTIKGSSESSVLDARYFLYTIVTYGKLTVKDITLNTDGNVNYMPYGGLEVENSRLNALATYQNIQLYEMSIARGATPQKPIIKVTDSVLKMYAGSSCIYYNVNNGELPLKTALLSF